MKEISRRMFFKLVGMGVMSALIGGGCKNEEEQQEQANIRVICGGISFVNADILNNEGEIVVQKQIELKNGDILQARPMGDFYIVKKLYKEGYALLRVPKDCGEEIQ